MTNRVDLKKKNISFCLFTFLVLFSGIISLPAHLNPYSFFFSSLIVLSFSLPCSVLFSFTLYFSSSFFLLSQTYEVLSDCKENCKNFHRRKYYFYNKGSASLLPSPTTAKMFQIHKTAPQCVWKKERFLWIFSAVTQVIHFWGQPHSLKYKLFVAK